MYNYSELQLFCIYIVHLPLSGSNVTINIHIELLSGLGSLFNPEATKHCKIVPFMNLVIDLMKRPLELLDATNGYGS